MTSIVIYVRADQRADTRHWSAVEGWQPFPADRRGNHRSEAESYDQYHRVEHENVTVHILVRGDRLTVEWLDWLGRSFADGSLPRLACDLREHKLTRAALKDWKEAKKAAGIGKKQDRYVYEGQMSLEGSE